MSVPSKLTSQDSVALLAEGVDRNLSPHPADRARPVALLAEGVDRNNKTLDKNNILVVALLAEGVDRNSGTGKNGELHYCRPPRGGRG